MGGINIKQMKRLGRFLAYMERGRKYVGIANSALILAIFLQTAGFDLAIVHYVLLIIAALVMYIFVGFIDTVMGLRKMENFSNEQNSPIHMDTYNNTNKILNKLIKDDISPGFWQRLKWFVSDIQVNDPMSEEEKEMIIHVCDEQLKQTP